MGELQLASIVRAQLRLALIVVFGVAIVIGGLPLLFALVPELRTLHVLGLHLPWLLLGVVVLVVSARDPHAPSMPHRRAQRWKVSTTSRQSASPPGPAREVISRASGSGCSAASCLRTVATAR